MSQIAQISQREIFPSNRSNAANTWSYKDGNPTLVFSINEQEAYLMSSTLRLNFKLRLQLPGTGTNPPVFPQNFAGQEVRLNAKIGALACFSSYNITNSRNQSLERVINAPRLAATLVPAQANWSSYANELQLECSATGNDDTQGRRCDHEQEVCCRVLAGCFLMGDNIPLGPAGRGCSGLTIRFNLAPSIEALYGAQAANAWYEIVNPSLTFQAGIPPGGVLPNIAALPYTSFSSFYSTIANSDETQNINCGLSSVISTFSNFVPTSYIANVTEDGNESYTLRNAPYTSDGNYAPITHYTTFKQGLKYPYQFSVDETEMITQDGTAYSAEGYTAQRARNFLSALQPSKDRTATLCGNLSEQGIGSSKVPPRGQHYNTMGAHVFGCGSRFDGVGNGSGANFKNASFSHRFRSDLDGNSPNSVYTFMLHRNMINFAGGGISVAN